MGWQKFKSWPFWSSRSRLLRDKLQPGSKEFIRSLTPAPALDMIRGSREVTGLRDFSNVLF